MKRRVGYALAVVAILIGIFLLGHLWASRRAFQFEQQTIEVRNDILELMDKLDADQVAFDLAEERAIQSARKLYGAAYTPDLREGVTDLSIEIRILRDCRAMRDRADSPFTDCLNRFKETDASATSKLFIQK